MNRIARSLALPALLAIAAPAHAGEGTMSAPAARQQVRAGKVTLIDVRSRAEWRQTGIPKGAQPISLHQPGGIGAFVAKVRAAMKGDTEAPIALICASGGRSSRARTALMMAGFRNVTDVSEGIMGRGSGAPGWLKRGLPTEPWRPDR